MLWYADTITEIDVEGIREELESYDYHTIPTENSNTVAESSNEKPWQNIQQSLATKGEQIASVAREALQKFASTVSSTGDLFDENLLDDEGSKIASNSSSSSREERYETALAEGMSMSSSTLKQELRDRGLYTTGNFFEKSDLVKAYANAVADGVERKDSTAFHDEKTKQEFDPSYRSVIMHKFDPRTLSRGDLVIDIPKI